MAGLPALHRPLRTRPRKRGKTTMRQGIIVLFFTALLFGQWGCASQPHLSEEIRARLGRVGLVSARYLPAVEFELPAKGRLAGAGRGAVRGTGTLLILVPGSTLAGAGVGSFAAGPLGLAAGGLLGAAFGAVAGAGYMIGGPIYGAMAAESANAVEETDAKLKAVLAAMRVQEHMRDYILQAASSQANISLIVVEGEGPETPSDLLTYLPLKEAPLDSILEVRVPTLQLRVLGTGYFFLDPFAHPPSKVLKINPNLSFTLHVRARLIQLSDRRVLYDNSWSYTGSERSFVDWSADEGKPFAMEVEHAYDVLARQMVSDLFLQP